MISRLIPYLIMFQIIAGTSAEAANAPLRNYQYHFLQSSCANSTDLKCYPFFYEDTYGNQNYFCNVVAGLNYFAPFLSLTVLKAGDYLSKRWDKTMHKEIDEQLEALSIAERSIRLLLSQIIRNFENGIGEDFDMLLASQTVEYLNAQQCQHCILKFVDIVSLNAKSIKQANKNRGRFHNFAKKLTANFYDSKFNCAEPRHTKIDFTEDEQSFETSCRKDWMNPVHWSSLSYYGVSLSFPWLLSAALDTKNRAGAFFGDLANTTNIIVIPTMTLFNLLQKYSNYDYAKGQKLAEEIGKRLLANHGIIDIAGRVLGKMDNGIDAKRARGFLIEAALGSNKSSQEVNSNLIIEIPQDDAENELPPVRKLRIPKEKLHTSKD